jgi:hypothetical protein
MTRKVAQTLDLAEPGLADQRHDRIPLLMTDLERQ